MKNLFLLTFLIIAVSCGNSNSNTTSSMVIGNGNDVTVTLLIPDTKNIKEISFTSNNTIETISIQELESYNAFIYKFENKGEGTFEVCVFTEKDKFCSESYVEQGYTPELKFENDSFIHADHGIGY